jgi:toxin ParE1/3/4
MLPKVESQILMSAHKYQLVITQPAEQDFRDILSYTHQTWGEQQRLEYKRKIDAALKAIVENPDIGRKKHGRMVFGLGRHQLYYQIKNSEIWLIRILHERMNTVRQLSQSHLMFGLLSITALQLMRLVT